MEQVGDGKQKNQNRIENGACAVLVLFALVCDAIGLIPFAKDLIGPVFWIIIALYLKTKGFPFFSNWEVIAVEVIDLIATLIPLIQEFPELTLGIIVILLMIRFEDKTGLSIIGAMQGNIKKAISEGKLSKNGKRLPPPRQALNSGGQRVPQKFQIGQGGEDGEGDVEKPKKFDITEGIDPEVVGMFKGYAAASIKNPGQQENIDRDIAEMARRRREAMAAAKNDAVETGAPPKIQNKYREPIENSDTFLPSKDDRGSNLPTNKDVSVNKDETPSAQSKKQYDYTRDYGAAAYWADHKEAKQKAVELGHDEKTAHEMASRAVDSHQKNGKYRDNRSNFERLNR